MAIVQLRKYRMNQFFMSMVGVWPWHSITLRRILLLILIIFSGSNICCQIVGIVKAGNDIVIIVGSATSISVKVMGIMKVINFLLNSKKIKMLLEQMINSNDWSSNSEEDLIMQSYTDKGQKTTTVMIVYFYTASGLHHLLPVLPQLLGTLGNKTREQPNAVYYPFDMDKYYYPIYVHGLISMVISCATVLAADTIFVVLVEHACGMFSIVGYKIRTAIKEKDEDQDINVRKCDDVTYNNIIECMVLHNKAIKFCQLIESAHYICFIFVVGLNMLTVSVTGVTLVMGTFEKRIVAGYSVSLFCLTVHLFIANHAGQRLLDHSLNIYTDVLYSNWYRTSPRAKKLLTLFIMRSLAPSVLTIGGRFVMCMENFSAILRTSASYFTILRSAQ